MTVDSLKKKKGVQPFPKYGVNDFEGPLLSQATETEQRSHI